MVEVVGKVLVASTAGDILAMTDDGEIYTTDTEKELDVLSCYGSTGVTSTSYVILVDLSDTTNFPHLSTGRVDITSVCMMIDKESNTNGHMYVGYVTAISSVSADIQYVSGLLFDKSSDTSMREVDSMIPSQIKGSITNGLLDHAVTNHYTSGTTMVNTATALNSPLGASTVTPGVGDIIATMVNISGAEYLGSVRVMYHGHE